MKSTNTPDRDVGPSDSSAVFKTLYDFGSEYAQTYINKCACGKAVEVSTQKDEQPEYYAEVVVKCTCGKSVLFRLPVN